MHMRHSDEPHGPEIVPVRFILQDPKALTGKEDRQIDLMAAKGESILEVALDHGINIEHACGGVVACSTCHVYINKGMEHLPEPEDAELDRVDLAPDLKTTSRLSCQCIVEGDGPIEVEVPAWNRNAVKEVPH